MSRASHPQSKNQFRSCAIGTLLLALPLSGIALRTPSAQAQPVPIPSAKINPAPPSPEQKASIDIALAVSRQETVCNTRVDIKVENATLEDVITRLKQLLPTGTLIIEVRDTSAVRVSFDLKQTRVGNVLTHVAALAGSTLFVLPHGLLISPPSKLSDTERQDLGQRKGGEWSRNIAAGGGGWSAMAGATKLFTRAIAQEATGSTATRLPPGVVKTNFGNFSSESQSLLSEMANWLNQTPAFKSRTLQLDGTSPIWVDTTDPDVTTVSFPPDPSNPAATNLYIQSLTLPRVDKLPPNIKP